MVERFRPRATTKEPKHKQEESTKPKGGNYFQRPKLSFIPTGCTLLDCVLGGGWALGRTANIVGDKSTGKTLLAIEAAANFARRYKRGRIWYRESEAAFDQDYAESVGLPAARVNFGKHGLDTQWDTIEDIFQDLEGVLDQLEKDKTQEGLYIIDSLDALSSRAALKREIGKGSYNLDKPKVMSEMFNQLTRRIKKFQLALLIISQVRDNIGVMFGEKYTRSGGHALDFYAAHVLWLSHIQTLTRQLGGVKRATGVRIRARCKKNKIVRPHGECEFVIRFGFGVDDLDSNLDWLAEAKQLKQIGLKSEEDVSKLLASAEKMSDIAYAQLLGEVREAVLASWDSVEAQLRPKRAKYAQE